MGAEGHVVVLGRDVRGAALAAEGGNADLLGDLVDRDVLGAVGEAGDCDGFLLGDKAAIGCDPCVVLGLERTRLQKRIDQIGQELLALQQKNSRVEEELGMLKKKNVLAEVTIATLPWTLGCAGACTETGPSVAAAALTDTAASSRRAIGSAVRRLGRITIQRNDRERKCAPAAVGRDVRERAADRPLP